MTFRVYKVDGEKKRRMNRKRTIGAVMLDMLEVYIPAVLFIVLFVCFLLGIFFRYVIKNPQSWTFELSTVAFLSSVILAGCLSDRFGEHISFDMIYDRRSDKTKTIMRVVSNSLILLFLGITFPASIKFILSFKNLSTPIMKIPQALVFCCFPVLLADLIIRSIVRLVVDIRKMINHGTPTIRVANDSEVVK